MRRYISHILILFMIFILTGCDKQNTEDVKQKDIFDIDIARNTVESYINRVSAGKYDEANELLTEKVKTDVKDIKTTKLKINGFKIEEMSEVGRGGEFEANVTKSNMTKPESQIIKYRFRVIKDGIDYKIDEIKVMPFREAFQSFGEIRLRKEDEADTLLVVDMEGIPISVHPQDDSGKFGSKIIPKGKFGAITLDYSGKSLAISTTGGDTYICILNIDDSTETQGGNGKQGDDGEEGSSGAGDKQNLSQGQKTIREKSIAKKLISCDIMENTTLENMVFSKDEDLLAVQFKKEGNRLIRVYNTNSGELIDFKFEEEYPINKVNIAFAGFDEETMKYTVTAKEGADDVSQYVGYWELDLEKFKAARVKE